MPDNNPPPVYWWDVSLYDGRSLSVAAAYPVFEAGEPLLKDQAHKIVFAAERGSGCTFTRKAAVTVARKPAAAADPVPVIVLPHGCLCTYSWEFSWMAPGRMIRNVGVSCRADHAEIDAHLNLIADGHAPARADEDSAVEKLGEVSPNAHRKERYDLGPIPAA